MFILFQPCNNPACLYLHSIGADEDSFGKDEAAAVHTRYHAYNFILFLYVVFQSYIYDGSVLSREKLNLSAYV